MPSARFKRFTVARLALHGDGEPAVSRDKVMKIMMKTDAEMKIEYAETARSASISSSAKSSGLLPAAGVDSARHSNGSGSSSGSASDLKFSAIAAWAKDRVLPI
jgi:hypothetical protein